MPEMSIEEARDSLDALAEQAAASRQRLTLTRAGRAVAVLLSVEELEDLEDAAALADYRAREAAGDITWVPHEEVRRRLGLPTV